METFFCFLIMAVIPLALRLFRIPRWSPAYVFGLFWWIQFAICYVIYPQTPWSVTSALYFMLCSIAVIIGFKACCKVQGSSCVDDNECFSINYQMAKQLIMLFTVLGLLYAIISLGKYGFSLSSLFNINTLLQMNNQIAVSRYGGTDVSSGIIDQVLLSFMYSAPMAGGCIYPYVANKKDKVLCLVTFVPCIIVLLSQNVKAGFVGCVVFWLSGFLVSKIRIQGSIKVPFKILVRIGLIASAVILVLMATMVLRLGAINARTIGIAQKKFINYLFGHIGAIDDWINANIFHSDLTLGGQTFIGVTRYFGYSDRLQGVYVENYIGPDLSTNIFTYFRGIYQDFGVLGSLLFFLVLGLIMGYTYRRLINRENGRSLSEMLLLMSYSFSSYFFVSIFSYASYIVAFIWFLLFSYFVYSSNANLKIALPKIRLVSRK